MNPDGSLDRDKLRQNLGNPSYDSINFLSAQLNNEVSLETNDLEGNLVKFFGRIATDITELSNEIENEISMLQRSALTTETFLLEELDDQSQKLVDVETAIEDVKDDFQAASDGAVRVGNKLANSERERLNIKKSIDLMKLVKEFQNSPEDLYSDVLKMNAQKLRETLPELLRSQDWHYISHVLYDLKKILFDINSEDVQRAQQVVINITEVVEMELLGQFDVLLDELMDNQENADVISRARTLAECLHLFNNGQSLHKRYIFSVVEKRIPSNAFLESYQGKPTLFSKVTNAIKKHGRKLKLPPGLDALAVHNFGDDDHASDSSSGASAGNGAESDEEDGIMDDMQQYQAGDSSLQLLDHLSRLFTIINRVCVEQFAIIKKVFPAHTIPRVTRQLIQRIFNDPAFGIQARVDAILNPQPPAPTLSLSDYLDALLTVREKLSALNVLLLECAADAAMIGMGSEVISMRKAKKEIATVPFLGASSTASTAASGSIAGGSNVSSSRGRIRTSSRVSINLGSTTVHLQSSSPLPNHSNAAADALAELYLEDQEYENEEKLKSDAEIREFFYEQSSQVLVNYLHDYFEKETMHVRNQYVALLRRAVDEHGAPPHGKVSAGTVLQLPHFRAERMKSIAQMVATVANKKFVDSIFNVTTDAVTRMESIGRDDKKLPNHVKDLYLLQLGFIAEGLILPWSKASITMLLRLAGSKPPNSALPPVDVLPSLVALTHGKYRLHAHFTDVFYRPLSTSPNLVAACKESRKKYFALIRRNANETVFAWTLCVAAHFEKLLLTLQGKYDYNPILEGIGAAAVAVASAGRTTSSMLLSRNRFNFMNVTGPSSACDAVCKAFIQVTNAVRRYEPDFVDLDVDALFWRPFGQQFIGLLIAHFRRQNISVDGARQFRRDLEEYRHVTALMNSAETSDMIGCLEEVAVVFEATSGDEVVRVVTEDLRHLDTSVVLGMVRVRVDFHNVLTGGTSAWAKLLSVKYLNYKWDTPLPWEGRKPVTILSFRDAMGNASSNKMGPRTLRRAGNAMPNVFVHEALRLRHLLPPPPPPPSVMTMNNNTNRDDVLGGLVNNNYNINNNTGSRTMSLDLRALETGRQNIIDRHIREAELQAQEAQQQQQLWGVASDEQQKISRFLPTRPDEDVSGIGGNGGGGGANANYSTAGNTSGTTRSVSTNGMGYAGANALPQQLQQPQSSQSHRGNESAGGKGSSRSNTNFNGNNNNNNNNNNTGAEKSPTSRNMFQRVTGFFR
jgi:hypothetical protein